VSRFTEDMQRRMRDAGISQARLAALIHVTPSYLSLIASGQRAPRTKVVRLIDQALDAGGQLAELAEKPAPAAPARPQPLGDTDASDARATMRHLVALDTLHGSDGLVPIAVRAFRTAADRLAVVGGTPDVQSAVADLGAAAAWITSDAVQREQSRTIGLESLALAEMAGDMRLRRFLLSHLSMVAEHAGRYAEALAYADRVLAEQPADPRVRAMFEVRRARALSGLGDIGAALAAWDHAEHLLTETPVTEDGVTYWLHDAEMAIHRAVILSRGHDRAAVDWARRGVDGLPAGQGRDQVLFRAMLLDDAVIARAWRDVPGIVDELLQHAGAGRSARVPELLERVWQSVQRQRVPAGTRDAVRAARDAFPS
jgi:transcriptional regulator with XRE-family HTH domain